MAYVVPGMKLIPQTMTMSCWYASAQMLIKWKEEQLQQSLANLISPEFDAECAKIRDSNSGITNPAIIKMAKRIGLKAIPPMSPLPETVESWLINYGPLWVNGKTHIVVISGIRGSGSGTELQVHDPSPVNVGKVDWRSMMSWYAMGSSVSTRDTSKDVETVFLYVPDDI